MQRHEQRYGITAASRAASCAAGEERAALRTRRDFLRLLTIAGAGIAGASLAGACAPLRVGLKLYPSELKDNPELLEETLRAFVLTVVPGLPPDDPDLTRALHDESFPLAAHIDVLAADLCERARRLSGSSRFAALDADDRARIVADALDAGGVTTQLYAGAAYLSQVACYAGIYDDAKGCPAIGFEGRFRPDRFADTVYPNPERFLAAASTADGNPA